MTFWHKNRSASIFGKAIRPKVFEKWTKKPYGRTDKNFIAQPKINLH